MLDIWVHSISRAGGVDAGPLRWVDAPVRAEPSGPRLARRTAGAVVRFIGRALVALGERLEGVGSGSSRLGPPALPAA